MTVTKNKPESRGFLYRIDPLTKLVMLLCISVLAVHIEHALPQLLLFAVVWIAIAIGSGQLVSGPLIRLLAAIGIPYFGLSMLSVREGDIWWQWGALQLTSGGLEYGAVMTLRIFILCLTSIALSVTTDYRELVGALVLKLKVPYRFAYGLALALTFLPLLREEARLALAARRLRGQRKARGWAALLQTKDYMGAVFTGSIRRIQHIAGAMEAKGFGAYPDRTFYHSFVLPSSALYWMSGSIAITIMLYIIL
ncbi:energy-coupling factor transporter transmembrane component T family protein [Paenibacillus shenyangensis]|uniref:energy-coupling factor transporter transmembrane component T family protein n=1 Tax=Paenibacillus sp. A9 TaxID=1284352 RepID=UPI00035EC056|nr:energy-coupling factor transporter transmembrane component T [Paenibacillus sp. A9]